MKGKNTRFFTPTSSTLIVRTYIRACMVASCPHGSRGDGIWSQHGAVAFKDAWYLVEVASRDESGLTCSSKGVHCGQCAMHDTANRHCMTCGHVVWHWQHVMACSCASIKLRVPTETFPKSLEALDEFFKWYNFPFKTFTDFYWTAEAKTGT